MSSDREEGGLFIFLVGQTLDAAGFVEKVTGESAPIQPESALIAIRMVIGPLPGVALLLGLVACWFYPITKKRYRTILRKLELRSTRSHCDEPIKGEHAG